MRNWYTAAMRVQFYTWQIAAGVLLAVLTSACRQAGVHELPPEPAVNIQDVFHYAADAMMKGRFRQAEQLYLKAGKQAELHKDSALLARVRYRLARLYYLWGRYGHAIRSYQAFLKEKSSQADNGQYRAIAWNLAGLGDLFFACGLYQEAILEYKAALEEWTKYNRWPETIHTLHRLALCQIKVGDYFLSKTEFDRCLESYDKTLALPGLKERRYLFDARAALAMEDYAHLLSERPEMQDTTADAAGLLADARDIWQQLSRLVPAATGQVNFSKVTVLQGLARHFCLEGARVEAMQVCDMLFDLQADTAGKAGKINDSLRADIACKAYLPLANCEDGLKQWRLREESGDNPYLDRFFNLFDEQDCFDMHQLLCHQYSWAVPDEDALSVLAQNQPIIEIGAGTGYWAYLLARRGARVAAYDIVPAPLAGNVWHRGAGKSWTEVAVGDETAIRRSSARTLFLCWPPEINSCAYNALRFFKGDCVIYVGEGPGGCSGTAEFHDLLKRNWNLVGQVEIPQWPGVYDSLFVFMRKSSSRIAGATGTASNDMLASSVRLPRQVLGERLWRLSKKAPTVSGDIEELSRRGFKIRFVAGPCRAFFDGQTHTINIAASCSDGGKLLAISHEYAHALLNPTRPPLPGKTSRQEFVEQAMEQEADAMIHELVAAQELQAAGVKLAASEANLLCHFRNYGRKAIMTFLRQAKNSATDEGYESHYNQWYDEAVKGNDSTR